jgi:hypothetical protein
MHAAHGLDFQNAQVGLPTFQLEQWIVVETGPLKQTLASDGSDERPAEADPSTATACTAKPMMRRVP